MPSATKTGRDYFSPSQARVLAALIEKYPQGASFDLLYRRVWPNPTDEPETSHVILKLLVHYLRHKLGRGAIQNIHALGYKLTPEGLEPAKELLATKAGLV